MCLTKYYRRCITLVVLGTAFILLCFLRMLCRSIPDIQLDTAALAMQRALLFNPRSITYSVFSYLRLVLDVNRNLAANLVSVAHMGNRNGIYFHWDDWVDLLPADRHLDHYRLLYPDGKCDQSLRDYSLVNPYFLELYNTKVARGMTNLYCLKDVPKRVLAATDTGFIEVPVLGKKRIGLSSMPRRIAKRTLVSEMEVCQKLGALESTFAFPFKVLPYAPMHKSVDINPQDFIFDTDKEIFALKEQFNKNQILNDDLQYLQFLEASNAMVDLADRFFKYPWIYTDIVAGRAHHTSFPFFKRYISNRERQSVLHHMVRVWFKFAEANDVASWINYGSLLGWAYNGVNMPWDTDIDIQLPIAQLDRLSRKYNSTLIIENPRDGNAKYLFEVSPTYTRQGNGRNFIDARFIDVNTGLYIDISVLSHTGHQPPQSLYESTSDISKLKAMPVHCKNWNWHSLDELLPIRHTFFEGASVYIPSNVLSILLRKYGQDSFTTKHVFNKHNYRKDLSLWVPEQECTDACGVALRFLLSKSCLNKCRSQWLNDEYRIVFKSAERHRLLNLGVDLSIDYEPEAVEELPLYRKDLWDYFNDINEKAASSSDWYVLH